MELIEQLFTNINYPDKEIGFLAEGRAGEHSQTQSFGELLSIIENLEGINQEDLYLEKGVLVEGQEDFLSAEILSRKDNAIRYAFFNDPQNKRAILSRIVERELEEHEKLFLIKGSDSTNNHLLKSNQIVSREGILMEAFYIAFLQNGFWYARNEEAVLYSPLKTSESEEELVLIDVTVAP